MTVSANAPPAPWLDADVGMVALGSASLSGSTFTVRGAGIIGGTADEFHYTYQPVSGNATIVARIATIQNTNGLAKVGVMIRESLAPNSRYASMLLTPAMGTYFQRRNTTGGTPTITSGPAAAPPHWVKLVRSGSTFTGSISSDGVTWTPVDSGIVSMPANVFIGLAGSSHITSTINTSTADGVSVTTP